MSLSEPGIGLLLLISLGQFFVGVFVIYLLEMRGKLNYRLYFLLMWQKIKAKLPFAACKASSNDSIIPNDAFYQQVISFPFHFSFLLSTIIETKHTLKKIKLEEDVRDEHTRIQYSNMEKLKLTEKLIVKNIYKMYRKKRRTYKIVNHLSFGVKPKECFG